MPKEIIIISGKGGTGKTSITAALAFMVKEKAVIADCDVDAADMHLLAAPEKKTDEVFYSGYFAELDNDKCINCGLCAQKCRFGAIEWNSKTVKINAIDCEGCGFCEKICPVNAITMKDAATGDFYISKTRFGNNLVHAKLNIGAENSGKLVAKVRKEAKALAEKLNVKFVIADGPPGIGCPVIASVTGADYIVMVTEPTISAMHDMKRTFELINQFSIKSGCIINKSDLNTDVADEIKQFIETNKIDFLGEINYTVDFSHALTQGKTIVETNNEILGEKLNGIQEKLFKIIDQN